MKIVVQYAPGERETALRLARATQFKAERVFDGKNQGLAAWQTIEFSADRYGFATYRVEVEVIDTDDSLYGYCLQLHEEALDDMINLVPENQEIELVVTRASGVMGRAQGRKKKQK